MLGLYAEALAGGVVISFDQMGPISLRPTTGASWAPHKRLERQRATFNRRNGPHRGQRLIELERQIAA